MEKKILRFIDYFKIYPNDKPLILEEISTLMKLDLTKEYQIAKGSSLYLWNLVERASNFKFLPEIFKLAHALPTGSASVEQCFSTMKLIKSQIRNRLQEATLEALLLIKEEFRNNGKNNRIQVHQEVLNSYEKLKEDINRRKSKEKNEDEMQIEINKENLMNEIEQNDSEGGALEQRTALENQADFAMNILSEKPENEALQGNKESERLVRGSSPQETSQNQQYTTSNLVMQTNQEPVPLPLPSTIAANSSVSSSDVLFFTQVKTEYDQTVKDNVPSSAKEKKNKRRNRDAYQKGSAASNDNLSSSETSDYEEKPEKKKVKTKEVNLQNLPPESKVKINLVNKNKQKVE